MKQPTKEFALCIDNEGNEASLILGKVYRILPDPRAAKDDFVRILTEPENALTRQYTALLDTEGVKLVFRDDAVAEIARIAAEVNGRTENIGARRLHTVMERLLDQISFDAPEMGGRELTIDAAYVRERLEPILQDQDLSRFIL